MIRCNLLLHHIAKGYGPDGNWNGSEGDLDEQVLILVELPSVDALQELIYQLGHSWELKDVPSRLCYVEAGSEDCRAVIAELVHIYGEDHEDSRFMESLHTTRVVQILPFDLTKL